MNPFHMAFLVIKPFHSLDDIFGLLDGLDDLDRDIVLGQAYLATSTSFEQVGENALRERYDEFKQVYRNAVDAIDNVFSSHALMAFTLLTAYTQSIVKEKLVSMHRENAQALDEAGEDELFDIDRMRQSALNSVNSLHKETERNYRAYCNLCKLVVKPLLDETAAD